MSPPPPPPTPPPPKALPPAKYPPLQPSYILRGHAQPIHSLTFLCNNTHLLSADAAGICILWTLSTRRPLAVWASHTASILSVAEWTPVSPSGSTDQRIITHGRDHKLRVWKFPRPSDDVASALPIDNGGSITGRAPWLVSALSVNALNFCGFAHCPVRDEDPDTEGYTPTLIAVPSPLESAAVDIFSLPSTTRVHARIQASTQTGMAMALSLHWVAEVLTLIAGYESGHVVVFSHQEGVWNETYISQAHTQPVLGLSVAPQGEWILTTAADALLVRHALGQEGAGKKVDTKHAGQQAVAVRSDGKIFATAGWDGRFRVFSAKTMKELAVLKWHTVGCYAVAFAEILADKEGDGQAGTEVARPLSVDEARVGRESGKHWIAGGAKDGKVSLWEVY
ncbi:WD40-repeat-containing domain protein [Tricharina praecox]|uniref:WD40-repeat-containing domain protein n=1 Tax=Tricharina praecox TaxID=43433 RepID=UPI00221F8330|nr:WD40-repeat-containing domain protein [Tricharina praecox]KAI5854043.1 WD40-repeat-containing domain protein [Tricharina praecox]